jgi:hypothetical protein
MSVARAKKYIKKKALCGKEEADIGVVEIGAFCFAKLLRAHFSRKIAPVTD